MAEQEVPQCIARLSVIEHCLGADKCFFGCAGGVDLRPADVAEIEQLIEDRRAARKRREFAQADKIRDDLAARGIILEDSAAGTRWKRK